MLPVLRELEMAYCRNKKKRKRLYLKLHLPPVYGLICNAGVSYSSDKFQYTEDGFEMTFGVYHLAHFLLANLLVDVMEENGRIVFVSSDTHDPAQKIIV